MSLSETIITALSTIGINAGPDDAEVRRFLDRAAAGENVTQYTVWQDYMNRNQTAYDLIMGPILAAQAAQAIQAPPPIQERGPIMPTAQALNTAVEAYQQMGHPEATPTNPDVINWANQGASKVDIWAAASTYINDPVWHGVAERATALLAATPNAVVSQAAQDNIVAFWNRMGIDPSKPHAAVLADRYPTAIDSGVDFSSAANIFKNMSPMALAGVALVALLILRR